MHLFASHLQPSTVRAKMRMRPKALAQQHTAEYLDGCGDLLQAVPRRGPWCRGSGAVFHPMCTSQGTALRQTWGDTEKASMIMFRVLCP